MSAPGDVSPTRRWPYFVAVVMLLLLGVFGLWKVNTRATVTRVDADLPHVACKGCGLAAADGDFRHHPACSQTVDIHHRNTTASRRRLQREGTPDAATPGAARVSLLTT